MPCKRNIIAPAMLAILLFAQTALANSLDYVIGAGDVLTITVTGEKDFSGDFTVRDDGSIFYSYLKQYPVAGQSVRQITDSLTKTLAADYISSPIVSVVVKEYASKRVQVLGAVKKPGAYILTGPTKLLDIISQAGGMDSAAGRNVLIIRTSSVDSSEKRTAKLDTAAGDAPEDQSKVAAAKDDTGAESNIAEPIVINYAEIVEKGKLENNVLIKSGDVINVPKADEVYVLGQVKNPGSIKFESNLTILQAVSLAGGTSEIASTKSTYVIRRNDDGKSQKIKVRLDKILAQKKENFPLQANDVIVIPESFF